MAIEHSAEVLTPADGLTGKPRELFEELAARLGAQKAETIRAVLEDASGAEWPLVLADWVEHMGAAAPLVIVRVALVIRSGETIPDEALAALPPAWYLLAVKVAASLERADRDRAERTLAELPPAQRRRELREGHRRNLAAIRSTTSAPLRANLTARLEQAHRQVARRVERHARRLIPSGSLRPARATAHGRPRRRERSARRRARAPTRRNAEGEPAQPPRLHRLPRSEAGGC